MTISAYLPDSILSHGQVFSGKALLAQAGRIEGIVPLADIPADATRIKLDGLTLATGLVDAQVNGGGGILFNDTPQKLDALLLAHQKRGTTSLLPALISDSLEKIPASLAAVREHIKRSPNSGVLGLHLEGPFLNPAKKGIHPAEKINPQDQSVLESLSPEGLGTLLVTLAPEEVAPASIRRLAAKGVIISAGHSLADAAQLNAAKEAGLTGITHLFNAMGGMAAREQGLAGLALDDNALFCSLITDGAHVEASMIRLATKAKPPEKLFLVSDAMPPAGETPPRNFTLLGTKIFARNGRCEDESGRLAGSALTLFECMCFAVQQADIPLPRAHAMASLNPALFLKRDKEVGSLEKGRRADFIAFDKTLKLEKIWAGGEPV